MPPAYLKEVTVSDPLGTVPYTFSLRLPLSDERRVRGIHPYLRLRFTANRRKKDESDYQIGAWNQVLGDAKSLFSYDGNGNLLLRESDDEERHFTYDALNRLTSCEVSAKRRVSYCYDSFGRRLQKTFFSWDPISDSWQQEEEESFLYQGETELASYREGSLQELRFFGQAVGSNLGLAVWMEIEGRLLLPIHDQRGNLAVILDGASGEMLEFYRTSSFGQRSAYNGNGEVEERELTPWGFAGKRKDEESGLIYFGQRYYDRELGRWLTPDPSGFSDGPNLYAYVLNNPCRFFDAFGLSSDCFESNPTCFESKPSCSESDRSCFKQMKSGFKQMSSDIGDFIQWCNSDNPNPYYFEFYEQLMAEGDEDRSQIINHFNLTFFKNGVFFVNGVNNGFEDCKNSGKYIANLAGLEDIPSVHNKSHGFMQDVLESALNLNNVATPPSALLKEMWEVAIKNLPPDAFILQIAHSQGAIHVRNTLADCPEHVRNKVIVLAIAPAAYIDSNMCHQVIHYRAKFRYDFIPYLFDGEGAARAQEQGTVFRLKSHPGAGYFGDHSFQSPTYKKFLEQHLIKYIKSGGKEI